MKKEWTVLLKLINSEENKTIGRIYWLDCSDKNRKVYWIGLILWELRVAYEEVKEV